MIAGERCRPERLWHDRHRHYLAGINYEHLNEFKARAFVVGPVNGASYDDAADLAAFKELLRTRRRT